MNTLILDFVGVVGDINLKNIIKDLPLKQEISAFRIFVAMKRNKKVKELFNEYQKGLLDAKTLKRQISQIYPHSAYIVPTILENLSKSIFVNNQVLKYVQAIKEKGEQVLLMSNSTPETELVIKRHNLDEVFDGIILSTEIMAIKPEKEIFEYAISTYNLTPQNTVMIDDTNKNLKAAEYFGITGIPCSNSEETCEILDSYLTYLDMTHHTEQFLNSRLDK